MSAALSPPPVEIPKSQSTVQVYIIDTTSFMSGFPASTFVEPLVPGFDTINVGSYAFLIKHPGSKTKYDAMVFDLGVRKDWENLPVTFVAGIKSSGCSITVDTDVASILKENGQDLNAIGAIIWSHWHFDHAGDPQTFPSTTDLMVGPGFKDNLMPGYPTVKDSHVNETAWQGRELCEIDFSSADKALKIGRFEAYDFYGDGSFYLLSSPGHAIGHMSALARTTADPPSFMLLGGDIAHHCGEFRPTPYTPLPETISPNPFGRHLGGCPGRLFLAIHPFKDPKRPFFDPTTEEGWHHEVIEAKESISKLIEADAYDNIFPVMAHDMTLGDTIELYPKSANDWMAKGWKEMTRWGFCSEFTPVEEVGLGNPAPPTGCHGARESAWTDSKEISIVHLEFKEGEKRKAKLHDLPL